MPADSGYLQTIDPNQLSSGGLNDGTDIGGIRYQKVYDTGQQGQDAMIGGEKLQGYAGYDLAHNGNGGMEAIYDDKGNFVKMEKLENGWDWSAIAKAGLVLAGAAVGLGDLGGTLFSAAPAETVSGAATGQDLSTFYDLGAAPGTETAATTATTAADGSLGLNGIGNVDNAAGLSSGAADTATTAGTTGATTATGATGTAATTAAGSSAQVTGAVQQAVQGGMSLQQAVASVSAATGIPASVISGVLSAAGNAIGNSLINGTVGTLANAATGALSSEAAHKAADQITVGSQKAADLLSTGYQTAGNQTAAGITQGATTTAAGYTTAADIEAAGAMTGANTLANGYQVAGQQEVAGLNKAQGAADGTLAQQKTIQAPYYQAGTDALQTLSAGLEPGGQFNKPFSMADMQNTMPAYTFARDQALEVMQNKMAAGGQNLGTNAIQGAGTLAAGLASQNEQQAFNQWMSQNNLSLGALQQMVNTGQTSTAQLQSALAAAGFTTEQIQTAIGAVQGTASIGAAKALSTGQINAATAQGSGVLGASKVLGAGQEKVGSVQGSATLGSAGAQATAATTGANAQAAGTVGSANAINTAIGNTANSLIGNAAAYAMRYPGSTYTMDSADPYAASPERDTLRQMEGSYDPNAAATVNPDMSTLTNNPAFDLNSGWSI